MLAENLLVEFVTNTAELTEKDVYLMREANNPQTTRQQFIKQVKHVLGGSFSQSIYDQIVWDYVADYWWDRREVPQMPEDNYSGLVGAGTYYLPGRI